MQLIIDIDSNDPAALWEVMETTGELLQMDLPLGFEYASGEYECSEKYWVYYMVRPT